MGNIASGRPFSQTRTATRPIASLLSKTAYCPFEAVDDLLFTGSPRCERDAWALLVW
jgi:hypothetical protein